MGGEQRSGGRQRGPRGQDLERTSAELQLDQQTSTAGKLTRSAGEMADAGAPLHSVRAMPGTTTASGIDDWDPGSLMAALTGEQPTEPAEPEAEAAACKLPSMRVLRAANSASAAPSASASPSPHATAASRNRPAARPRGPDVGRRVAISNPSKSPWFHQRVLSAGATLGVAPDEAQALALARTLHRDVAVVPAEGQYFVYAIAGANDLDLELVYGGSAGLRIEAGVAALVNDKGLTYRAGDLAARTERAQPSDGASADPFGPYQSLHRDRGGIEGLGEAELLATFEAAMFDTALAVLAESEAQAQRKAEQLGTRGATSPTEHGQIEATARALLSLQTQLDQTERHVRVIQSTPADPDTHDHPPGWFDDLPRLQKELPRLTAAKRQQLQRYPMLGRYRSADELQAFLSLPATQREQSLAGNAGSVRADIFATRRNLQSGDLDLWGIPSVVDATLAGLGIGEGSPQRQRVQRKAKSQRTKETIRNLALTAFSIGFGIAGAVFSGGTSLAFTAGAVGLGAYDAITTTEDYFVQNAATNTDLDPDGGLLPDDARMHWGWLVAAWAGVALDFADVLKAAKIAAEVEHVSRGGKSIRQAAEVLAHGDAKLLERLRRAAGDAALTDTLSEAMRPTLSARIGAEILIDGTLGKDVKVVYDVGAGGRTSVTHVRVGPTAKVGDILAHTDTIRMLDRYGGVAGRARQLWDRLSSFGAMGKAGSNPFEAGSQAFESWHELQKLQPLIGYRRGLLADLLEKSPSATEAQVALRKQLDFLENEVDLHQRVVDGLVNERGVGAISMSDATRDALSSGHELPEFPGKTASELSAEELKSSAHYFKRQPDGTFTLEQKLDKAATAGAATAKLPLSAAMQHAKSVAGSAARDSLKKHVFEPAELAAAEAKIRPPIEAAIADEYEKAIAGGKTIKQARYDATKLGTTMGHLHALEAAKEAATARARSAVADGTAFDMTKLDAASTTQLARYGAQTFEAHRLAPKLAGKKDAEFLSLMAEEVSTGRAPPPRSIAIKGSPPQLMSMWEYPDGTVVRHKPLGDGYRTTPAFSIEVKSNSSLPDTGPEGIAFKVDQQSRTAPKSDKQISNPYSRSNHPQQFAAFENAIMTAVHLELK